MKLFRYRKPSLKSALGITKAKRRLYKATGISAARRYTPSRIKQKIKYRTGYYSTPMKIVRNSAKGNFPTPLGIKSGSGCASVFVLLSTAVLLFTVAR